MLFKWNKIRVIAGVVLITLLTLIFGFYIIEEEQLQIAKLNISGVVVPHHNMVADQRAQFFSELAEKIVPPQTIILVSPNHYYAGSGQIQSTSQDWNIGQGQILANQKIVSFLTQNKLATNEPSSFTNEHGIYNILADIKNNFPSATLVPLIIKNASLEQVHKLALGLEQSCADCLMIASVDFSHYQPALLGQLHDDYSLRAMQKLDTENILNKAEVDSGPTLALLTSWANNHQTDQFKLWEHTNSGIISQNPDAESTTHIFGWYEAGDKTASEKSVSFIVGGDVMFARKIHYDFKNNFNKVVDQLGDRVFWGTDASIVNLEGSITNQPIKDDIRTDNLNFRFLPAISKTLEYLHINAVSQANNHSDNAGSAGIKTTRSVLNNINIQTFGGPTTAYVADVATFKGQGLNLTVIGINLTFPNQNADSILSLIIQLKKDPLMKVIVMPHWGVEYLPTHTATQANVAHAWIDAGADMVIGGHPHVIEDAEIYKNAPIIYSLGNLLFDQAFSQPVQEGLLIAGKFTDSALTFFALPTQSIHYQPRLLTGQRKREILDQLYTPLKNHLVQTPAGAIVQISK